MVGTTVATILLVLAFLYMHLVFMHCYNEKSQYLPYLGIGPLPNNAHKIRQEEYWNTNETVNKIFDKSSGMRLVTWEICIS